MNHSKGIPCLSGASLFSFLFHLSNCPSLLRSLETFLAVIRPCTSSSKADDMRSTSRVTLVVLDLWHSMSLRSGYTISRFFFPLPQFFHLIVLV
ncbi:hypothetical protein BJX68DRAFT_229223, partial [Aspergillus pseudodeflectus]